MEKEYEQLEDWFTQRHLISKKEDYMNAPYCTLGDRFEEIREFMQYVKQKQPCGSRKATLLGKIKLSNNIVLDKGTALTFLHMNTKGKYVFCVNKLHGSGKSAIELSESEFNFIR